jgi:hypothetical protein
MRLPSATKCFVNRCCILCCLQVRGKNPPRPIRAWTQSGISSKVLEMLRKQGFDRPLAIQAQVWRSFCFVLKLCMRSPVLLYVGAGDAVYAGL